MLLTVYKHRVTDCARDGKMFYTNNEHTSTVMCWTEK